MQTLSTGVTHLILGGLEASMSLRALCTDSTRGNASGWEELYSTTEWGIQTLQMSSGAPSEDRIWLHCALFRSNPTRCHVQTVLMPWHVRLSFCGGRRLPKSSRRPAVFEGLCLTSRMTQSQLEALVWRILMFRTLISTLCDRYMPSVMEIDDLSPCDFVFAQGLMHYALWPKYSNNSTH